MFVAQHAHGEVHFLAHFFGRGGDGVEARGERAQQAGELLGGERGGVLRHDTGNRVGGGVGGSVGGGLLQLGIAGDFGVALHELRGVQADFPIVQQGFAHGFAPPARIHRLVALERDGGEDFVHDGGVVFKPYAQRVARAVLQAGAGEVDFDVAHVFFRIAAGDFLAGEQGGGEGVGFVVGRCGRGGGGAARSVARTGCSCGGRGGQTAHQRHDFVQPGGGFGLVFQVTVLPLQQTFAAEFG